MYRMYDEKDRNDSKPKFPHKTEKQGIFLSNDPFIPLLRSLPQNSLDHRIRAAYRIFWAPDIQDLETSPTQQTPPL